MEKPAKISIKYLPVRALGEPLRMLCAFAGIEYTDYTFEDIDGLAGWRKKTPAEKSEFSPTEQLPAPIDVVMACCVRLLATRGLKGGTQTHCCGGAHEWTLLVARGVRYP